MRTLLTSGKNYRNSIGLEKKPFYYSSSIELSQNNSSAKVVFLPQPLASLAVSGKRNFFISPYPITGEHIVCTGFSVEPWQRELFYEQKLDAALAGFAKWESLPQKSIVGQVNITSCVSMTDKLFEKLSRRYKKEVSLGLITKKSWVCYCKEPVYVEPIKTTMFNIVSSILNSNVSKALSACKQSV